jgi:hypothetical protein
MGQRRHSRQQHAPRGLAPLASPSVCCILMALSIFCTYGCIANAYPRPWTVALHAWQLPNAGAVNACPLGNTWASRQMIQEGVLTGHDQPSTQCASMRRLVGGVSACSGSLYCHHRRVSKRL